MKKILIVLGVAALLGGAYLVGTLRVGGTRSMKGSEREATNQSEAIASEPDSGQVESPPEPTHLRVQTLGRLRICDDEGHPLSGVRVDRLPRPTDWRTRLDSWPLDPDVEVDLDRLVRRVIAEPATHW